MAVYFTTPGTLDIDAIRVFGLHDKPNTTSPIGFFGTGLKYALAVLLRNGASVNIYAGEDEYRFSAKTKDFRTSEVTIPVIQKRRQKGGWTTYQLPFTLQLGKTWEMWMAYRELASNTMDEQGYIMQDDTLFPADLRGRQDKNNTIIRVEHPKFDRCHDMHNQIFLNPDEKPWYVDQYIEVFRRPSKHLYYRGMRVYDFAKNEQSLFTYNYKISMELTEDRTLKYVFMATHYLQQSILDSDNENFVRPILEAIINKADADDEKENGRLFETRLDFSSINATATSLVRRIISELKPKRSSLATFYRRYIEVPRTNDYINMPPEQVIKDLRWWLDSGEIDGHTGLTPLLRRAIVLLCVQAKKEEKSDDVFPF